MLSKNKAATKVCVQADLNALGMLNTVLIFQGGVALEQTTFFLDSFCLEQALVAHNPTGNPTPD